jgi:alpha-mannosidase
MLLGYISIVKRRNESRKTHIHLVNDSMKSILEKELEYSGFLIHLVCKKKPSRRNRANRYIHLTGYSAQLPQVLRQSGCDYFFTQKLSWNNINKFPLSTFWWTGIDDTRILAHLTPAET